MNDFREYKRTGSTLARPYVPGESALGVTISLEQTQTGSPKEGDMIAMNPDNHADRWLITKEYFAKNFSLAPPTRFGSL